MSKYVLVRKEDDGSDIFVKELSSEDSFTDDLGDALIFDSEDEALRERLDDEKVAVLSIDEDGWSYEVQV